MIQCSPLDPEDLAAIRQMQRQRALPVVLLMELGNEAFLSQGDGVHGCLPAVPGTELLVPVLE